MTGLITNIFGGLQTTLIAGAVALVVGGAGGAYAGYRWEVSKVDDLKLAAAQAQAVAVKASATEQHQIDTNNTAAAVKDAQAQQTIVTRTVTLTQKVPVYVHDQIVCRSGTYGFIRLLVAAERGVDPATLVLPAGVSDDTCALVEPSDLAAQLVADFGAANQNGQQLNDLIASVKANVSVATTK